MNAHYVFEEDDPTYCRDYEDEEVPDRDPFVLDCGDPRCLMPGEHFLSECYTLEMAEAWE